MFMAYSIVSTRCYTVLYILLLMSSFPLLGELKENDVCKNYNDSMSEEKSIAYSYALILRTASKVGKAKYIGCFTPLNKCTLRQGKYTEMVTDLHNDVVPCIKDCWEKKMKFALLKDGFDCLCSTMIQGLVETKNSHCNAPCGGNDSHACGGAGRIGVYYTGYIEEPQFTQASRGDVLEAFKGCYEDITYSSVCPFSVETTRLNVPMCMSFCEENLFTYAAMDTATRCCCTRSLETAYWNSKDYCTIRCKTGRSGEACGGDEGYLAVYATDVSQVINMKGFKPEVPAYIWMHPNLDDKIVQHLKRARP